MRPLFAALFVLLAAPLDAQTCGGAITLPLARAHEIADSTDWRPVSTFYFDAAITAVAATDEGPPPNAPLDWFLARRDRFEIETDSLRSRFAGLLQPPDTMQVRTQCGYALLRLAITDRWERETMTLDFYDVPAHVPVRPSRPIPFRPGRFTLSVEDAVLPEGPGYVFDVDRIVRRD